jgi:hypothetical protein
MNDQIRFYLKALRITKEINESGTFDKDVVFDIKNKWTNLGFYDAEAHTSWMSPHDEDECAFFSEISFAHSAVLKNKKTLSDLIYIQVVAYIDGVSKLVANIKNDLTIEVL